VGSNRRRWIPTGREVLEAEVRATGRVTPPGLPPLTFAPDTDLTFDYGPPLPGHANGMILRAFDTAGNLYLEEPITPSAAASS
jgi:L-serine dehydratase